VFLVSVKSDAELLVAAKAGDKEACSLLFAKYRTRLYWFIRKKAKNSVDTEDVVQEAFMDAYTYLKGFRGDSEFFTWLCTIAIRRLYKRRYKPLERHGESSTTDTPETRMVTTQDIGIVNTLISRLPDKQRKALIGREYEGKSYPTLGKELQCTPNYAKKLVFKAKKSIRKEYNDY